MQQNICLKRGQCKVWDILKPLQNHLWIIIIWVSQIRFYATYATDPFLSSSVFFLLHAHPLRSSSLSSWKTTALHSQMNAPRPPFLPKHFINLAADRPLPLICPIRCCLWNKICVKYIDLTEGFSHVFQTAPLVLWLQTNTVSKCVSLFVYTWSCMCALLDDAWLTWNTLI